MSKNYLEEMHIINSEKKKIKLGSLFDGIGVFPLAASRWGIEPVWASEIGKAAVSITKKHFPAMRHLGDIKKIRGNRVEAVQVLTFGSPCQDLSVAGFQSGLQGKRSGLFFGAIRIIKEMRYATNELYPTIVVWENVMGAFSANHRMDFKAVLESFADTEVPMPSTGKWATAGMVRGGESDISWRVLDSQYWGRPRLRQQRRRVFLVADFGGERSGEILFKSRKMYLYSASGTDP